MCIDFQIWGSSQQDHGLGWACRQITNCEAVCNRVLVEAQKMPPWREHDGRAVDVTPKGFRALER